MKILEKKEDYREYLALNGYVYRVTKQSLFFRVENLTLKTFGMYNRYLNGLSGNAYKKALDKYIKEERV